MPKILRLFQRFSILFPLLLFYSYTFASPPGVKANSLTESFDLGITNPILWEFRRESGISYLGEGSRLYAHFAGAGSFTFPYIRSQDLTSLPIEDITFDARFADNSINQGSGIVITDNVPLEWQVLDFSSLLFYIWPKPNGSYHLFTPLCPSDNLSCSPSTQLANGVVSISSNIWHTIELVYDGTKYLFFVDDVLLFQSQNTDRVVKTFAIGQPEIVHTSATWSSFDVDELRLNHEAIPLFPYYSQLDPLWAGQEYDEASEWAPEGEQGIDRWGCVLTSAAMVFKDFGINTPTNEEPTPSALNTWLNDQPDGYIRNGLVNWISLTRMARESYENSYADTKVKFQKKSYSEAQADDYTLPSIFGLPGHSVVGYGSDNGNYLINDPADETNTSLAKAGNIDSVNTYTPSSTDLSYMMFVVDPDVSIELFNAAGESVGEVFEEYLDDDIGDGATSPLKILLLAIPDDGEYQLVVSNPSDDTVSYNLDMYFYDEDGNPTMPDEAFAYMLGPGDSHTYYFDYVEDDLASLAPISLGLLRERLWEMYDEGDIKTKGTAQSMDRFLDYAERFDERLPWLRDNMLKLLSKYVERHTPRLISEEASEVLLAQLDLLL